jgi:hypothetical protein
VAECTGLIKGHGDTHKRRPIDRAAPEPSRGAVIGFVVLTCCESAVMVQAHGRKSARRKTGSRKTAPRKTASHKTARRGSSRRWSARVTRESDALDLDKGVFTRGDPKKIAASLKRSAMRSRRRKADPYRSALSMLVFYINRAGKNLPASRRKVLQQAKGELRKQFGRG